MGLKGMRFTWCATLCARRRVASSLACSCWSFTPAAVMSIREGGREEVGMEMSLDLKTNPFQAPWSAPASSSHQLQDKRSGKEGG